MPGHPLAQLNQYIGFILPFDRLCCPGLGQSVRPDAHQAIPNDFCNTGVGIAGDIEGIDGLNDIAGVGNEALLIADRLGLNPGPEILDADSLSLNDGIRIPNIGPESKGELGMGDVQIGQLIGDNLLRLIDDLAAFLSIGDAPLFNCQLVILEAGKADEVVPIFGGGRME